MMPTGNAQGGGRSAGPATTPHVGAVGTGRWVGDPTSQLWLVGATHHQRVPTRSLGTKGPEPMPNFLELNFVIYFSNFILK